MKKLRPKYDFIHSWVWRPNRILLSSTVATLIVPNCCMQNETVDLYLVFPNSSYSRQLHWKRYLCRSQAQAPNRPPLTVVPWLCFLSLLSFSDVLLLRWRGKGAPASGQFLILPLSDCPPGNIMMWFKPLHWYVWMTKVLIALLMNRQLVTLTSNSVLWRLLSALTAFTRWSPFGKNRQNSPDKSSSNIHDCLDFL